MRRDEPSSFRTCVEMKGLEKWEVVLILVRIKILLRYNVVYQFLKLVLVFPVATASVAKGSRQ